MNTNTVIPSTETIREPRRHKSQSRKNARKEAREVRARELDRNIEARKLRRLLKARKPS